MRILKKTKPQGKSSSKEESPLDKLRKGLVELADLKAANNAANNAVNRKKTVLKKIIRDYLVANGGTENDGLVLDGMEIAFRQNVSEEISPRVWYDWWQKKYITDNQYFGAIGVSITDARNAVGNDQIGEISHETLTKTDDLRVIKPEAPFDLEDGSIVKFGGAKVKVAKEARKLEVDNSGKPLATLNKKAGIKRKLRLGK